MAIDAEVHRLDLDALKAVLDDYESTHIDGETLYTMVYNIYADMKENANN